ncbi:FAD-dependent 5-carboxymethylaminomethyl-2-thiouridine(34) oxidoreductase MnmC [Phenylobacterium sp.]|uniref:FAD-dependent 5-carboxymethylaminomethyl-2-thiouridine(34) oxidoreductase MnmC n=1 Tax=Phenylobacterium sp. TaxID=1871053 RepID=UPI002732BAD7|nr:FAD-dependent 5-carboxymethylaminomethyl-2-thiouridine(34) oxidoreductase MnmC [Phenylobacterium sp.]
MIPPPAANAEDPLIWADDGPRSRFYGDIYFSTADGLAESRAVFLQGCGLPQAWSGRERFVVGELGFGTGLNVAALLDLWRAHRPPGARLHVFSVEAHPLGRADAVRALAAWPELADAAQALLDQWPGRATGFHRLELPGFDAIVDVAVLDVAQALGQWSGRADAWFLDGFSPALNPAMWRQEVLDLVAARSAPGARAATFTVAGAVRRGLAQAGFTIAKQPGYGRKRERLEAWFEPQGGATTSPSRRVAIIGAGVAGAASARAVRVLGGEAVVYEAHAPGAGASGNPVALATPRLDAGLGPPARLFAQAFARAAQLYEATPGAVLARGVLQLAVSERDPGRFATIAASNLFEPGDLELLEPDAVGKRLGEAAPAALAMETALTIAPAAVLCAWIGGQSRVQVARLEATAGGWRLLGSDGETVGEADAVIVAAGAQSGDLVAGAALSSVRGQVSWAALDAPAVQAAAWGGYAAPTVDGVLFGATYDRGDVGLDVRDADHRRNLETLAATLPALARRLAGARLQGRAALRAVTPDRLPLAGSAGQAGLYLLSGLGSRGFTLAPLLAEQVAALALGAPSPLPGDLAALVDPARFEARAARRGRP